MDKLTHNYKPLHHRVIIDGKNTERTQAAEQLKTEAEALCRKFWNVVFKGNELKETGTGKKDTENAAGVSEAELAYLKEKELCGEQVNFKNLRKHRSLCIELRILCLNISNRKLNWRHCSKMIFWNSVSRQMKGFGKYLEKQKKCWLPT